MNTTSFRRLDAAAGVDEVGLPSGVASTVTLFTPDSETVRASGLLDRITPVLLTYNESPNIGRSLDQLRWAKDIVVVDSFSDDDTVAVAQSFPGVRVFKRRFDSHSDQWNFALCETGIISEWILALDADYILTDDGIKELGDTCPAPGVEGYRCQFTYCVNGKPLRGSAYPPVVVLYRREAAHYEQDGHSQRVSVKGAVEDLAAPILHDDRKSLAHWLWSQSRYMQLEAHKLAEAGPGELGMPDQLRKLLFIAPFAVFFYCLVVKLAILDGWPGLYYAIQRMTAESILSLYLIEERIRQTIS
ncbi:MAG TPA: glycosyltransferase family 2 protein [Blastocatellia bacterium]